MKNSSQEEMMASKAGLTVDEWRKETKFDSVDRGWVIMSIGMAIGAGIVYLPVKVGIVGIWTFLISVIIAYPAIYLFQKLFINTLAESKECVDYPTVITNYLGKNWGFFLGILYFLMLVIWVFIYSTCVVNDSASFLQTFGVTKGVLSDNLFYSLAVICILVLISSLSEKLLFKISGPLVIIKLAVIVLLGIVMIRFWNLSNLGAFPPLGYLIKQTIVLLPFTLTSIIFIQSLSPMVISYRAHNKNIEVARYKASRAMKIAFLTLFAAVLFYAFSFSFSIDHAQAVEANKENISALAIAAKGMSGNTVKVAALTMSILAVVTAFFSNFQGFREACQGIAVNVLKRFMPESRINMKVLHVGILIFAILITWLVAVINAPILNYTSYCSPIFGIIGCLLPTYLVYKVPALHHLKSPGFILIILTGILLVISPFLAV